MKKLVKPFSIVATLCLALMLNGCLSESNIIPDPYYNGGEESGVVIRFVDNEAIRAATIPDGSAPAFTGGHLLFVRSNNTIARYYRIHNVSENHSVENRELYIGLLRNDGVVIPAVAPGVNRIVVVGNTNIPAPAVDMNFSDIALHRISVLSQNDLSRLNLWGESLRSSWTPSLTAPDELNATVSLRTTVARFELYKMTACPTYSNITSFRVEGIFIDNHYFQAHVIGTMPTNIIPAPPTPTANFVSRGENRTLFAEGQFGYDDNDIDGALFDIVSRTSTTNPATLDVRTFPSNNPNRRWAYNVFAASYPADSRMPSIIIRLSNVYVSGQRLQGHQTSGYHYLTINSLRRRSNTNEPAFNRIQSHYVYTIHDVLFTESNLTHYPSQQHFEAEVTVTLAEWNRIPTGTPGFHQPNPIAPGACGAHTFNLGVAVCSNCYPNSISYLWQQRTIGGAWVNAVAGSGGNQSRTFTTPALTQDMEFRRKATCSCRSTLPIFSSPARIHAC